MEDKLVKVAHLTSVHSRSDTRIFFKECLSLSKIENYKIFLIVADGLGYEEKNNIKIYDVGAPRNRLSRVVCISRRIFKKAKELDADIYHFHDPELIPVGVKLKGVGKKVIFDIHENVALQIKDKEYLNPFVRYLFSKIYSVYEKIKVNKFDHVILAETSYFDYYPKVMEKKTVILNVPDIERTEKFIVQDRSACEDKLFYIGGISVNRGVDLVIDAFKSLKNDGYDISIDFVGPYDLKVISEFHLDEFGKSVKFHGRLPLDLGLELSKTAKIGLSILKPIDNYKKSYSTKVFEYMAVGLPVITSNFELYKNVVEKNKCGLCVNPLDVKEIVDAIKYVLDNPDEANNMGKNGVLATRTVYNWCLEKDKLRNVYEKTLL